jgi:hypothetical protein
MIPAHFVVAIVARASFEERFYLWSFSVLASWDLHIGELGTMKRVDSHKKGLREWSRCRDNWKMRECRSFYRDCCRRAFCRMIG